LNGWNEILVFVTGKGDQAMESIARYGSGQNVAILTEFSTGHSAEGSDRKSA